MMEALDRKAYIHSEKIERGAAHEHDQRIYTFCEFPTDAMYYEDRYIADRDCAMFNHNAVIIPSAAGGSHTITNFEVEAFENRFVIFCIAPFVYTARGAAE